ncbi:MAG TPA: HAD family hydrolase [bacterium]|nr:HAD family hydrolase [bacterium]
MLALRAVCFDLDGTLLDSLAAHHAVYRKVFAALGRRLDDRDYAARYSPNWYLFYERMGLPREQWPQADRLWLRHYADEAPAPRPYADTLLAALRASGRRLGLVTSGDRSRVERDLHRSGWMGAFDVVVCGGDVPERKPLPGPLRYALERLGVDPPAALYVGDTVEDIAMARAAGTRCAAVLGGFGDRDALAAAQPDAIVTSLAELGTLLG